jgi:hypothetical protein
MAQANIERSFMGRSPANRGRAGNGANEPSGIMQSAWCTGGTMRAMTTASSLRARSFRLSLLGNFGGAVLSLLYFHQIDTLESSGTQPLGAAEIGVFVVCFALLYGGLYVTSARWRRPVTDTAGSPPPGAPC